MQKSLDRNPHFTTPIDKYIGGQNQRLCFIWYISKCFCMPSVWKFTQLNHLRHKSTMSQISSSIKIITLQEKGRDAFIAYALWGKLWHPSLKQEKSTALLTRRIKVLGLTQTHTAAWEKNLPQAPSLGAFTVSFFPQKHQEGWKRSEKRAPSSSFCALVNKGKINPLNRGWSYKPGGSGFIAALGKFPTSRFNCGKASHEIQFECNSKLFRSSFKNHFHSPHSKAGSLTYPSAKKPCHLGLQTKPHASNK